MRLFSRGRAAALLSACLAASMAAPALALNGPIDGTALPGSATGGEHVVSSHRTPLMYDPRPSDFRVPAPPEPNLLQKNLSALQASITVNYLPGGTVVDGDNCITWSAAAQAAFSYAASVWASQLQSPVPITIDACYANNLGSGVLGQAGPRGFYRNFTGAPFGNTWYPAALANAISGTDLAPGQADIYAAFSSTFSWYYGTDGHVPYGQLDFVSVVMHEIGHGLGFTGSMDVVNGSGSWGMGSSLPFGYDRYTENGAGQSLINTAVYPNPSASLAAALQSNSVYFDGPNADAGNGGGRVPLHAPSTWNDGSSYSHLAESFNGTVNALMTYSLSSGESIHNPGPVALGVLKDLGWPLQNASTADVALAQSINANPAITGKDAIFTMTASNAGPGTATGVVVTAAYDASAAVIWASPGCAKQSGTATYVCTVGTLAPGASTQHKLVLRKSASGSVFNNASVSSATGDPVGTNNSASTAVSVFASATGTPVWRYRLYSPVTQEHHFTTDANEYAALGAQAGTWVQEGTAGKVLDNPGSYNAVAAVPYYRLYNASSRQHHWTTDPNEYYTLLLYPGWQGEGVDGYILPAATAGATQLFRLVYPYVAGLHHWTIDANEYNTLIAAYGWVGERGSGFVIQ